MKKILIDRIEKREAVIGIAGLGYVGLPLALRFAEAGFRVTGFDIDASKVVALNGGESYFRHIPPERVATARSAGRLEATGDFSAAKEVDALILCVPTPLGSHQEPDLTFIISTIDTLLPYIKKGAVVSLESTTYPGTTEEELKPRLENSGLIVGEDVFLVYSPEREDPGNEVYSTKTIPKVVGGVTPACLEVGKSLYGSVIDKVVTVSSTRAAEMTKLVENIYRAVNIGMVNELKVAADRMDIDIWEVIDAAASKPFGFTPFYPGPGIGGHCIPIDPFYLTWKAREYGFLTRFIELAGQVNTAMPDWVASKVADSLNDRGRALKGSRVLVLGIAYKKNLDDMRESPAVALMEILSSKGADILYSDPYVPVFPKMRKHYFDLGSVTLTTELLSEVDCVLIATDHDAFDYELIRKHSNLVVDTRGRYRDNHDNVVRA